MNMRKSVLTALFAALIAAGAYIAIPIGPVPITLQGFFMISAAILGGWRIGLSSVSLYLIAGALGLPVFSGGTGSIAHFMGPTGGYLLGMLPAAFLTGFISELGIRYRYAHRENQAKAMSSATFAAVMIAIGALAGSLTVYVIGVPWLKAVLNMEWSAAFKTGMIPFILGDAIKLVAAVAVGTTFSLRVHEFLKSGDSNEPA